MKFTSKDIDNNGLKIFIRTKIKTEHTIILDNVLFNHYDTKEVIKALQSKIKKHEKGTNSTKYIPVWEGYINTLRKLESSSGA